MADRFQLASAVLLEELAKPYREGSADCFMLGCRVADALDPTLGLVARYGGRYTTLAGAQKALRREGFKSLVDLHARHFPRIAPAQAQTGDLVIVSAPAIVVAGKPVRLVEHVAVCFYQRLIGKTERGRTDYDLEAAIAAFAVGRSA